VLVDIKCVVGYQSDKDGGAFPDRLRFMSILPRSWAGLSSTTPGTVAPETRRVNFILRRWGLKLRMPSTTANCFPSVKPLDELAKAEAVLAEIVDLRFFCDFTFGEIAAMRDICERTAQRQWEKARISLYNEIRMELEE